MSATLYIGLTSDNINFDFFQADVIVLAASSTQPNKADCSFICQDQVDKLMLCVKTEDSGLNNFFLNCIHI